MIHFTCPGCKAAHTANEAFADRRAKCVRCGASMYIPREDGEATFAPYGVLDRANSGPASAAGSGPNSAAQNEQEGKAGRGEGETGRRRNNLGLVIGILILLLIAGIVAYIFLRPKPAEPTKKADPPVQTTEPTPEPPPPYEFVGPIWDPPPRCRL